jgi:hypothetical protein
VWEGCKLDDSFGEDYLHVRLLGLHDWAFDPYMINLAIVILRLPLVLETEVGASGDGVYSSECWKIGGLLRRLLVLRWRWGWVVWLYFWLDCLGACSGICYL